MRNHYTIKEEVVYIQLDRRKGPPLETKVDLSDLPKLLEADIKWVAQWNACTQSFYVAGYSRGGPKMRKRCSLHRFILDTPTELEVDHKHHDTLDNRRSEIRNVTRLENMANRRKTGLNISRGRGYHKRRNGYRVAVWCRDLSVRKDVKTEEEAKALVLALRSQLSAV